MFGRKAEFLRGVGILFILFFIIFSQKSYADSKGVVIATVQIIPPLNTYINGNFMYIGNNKLELFSQNTNLIDRTIQFNDFVVFEKFNKNFLIKESGLYF